MKSLLLLLILIAPTLAQPIVRTDDSQLPRDHQSPSPVLVAPELWDQVPWQNVEPGVRRRVVFSDRLTFVLLEIDKAPDQSPLKTHYHTHDQVSYIVEGRAIVSLDGQEMEVGPGAAYSVPSNVHHGLKVLTSRLVLIDCFTPTREDFRSTLGENEIRAFVYTWFGLLDRAAPFEALRPHLNSEQLDMQFPEVTLRSLKEFEDWWTKVPKGKHSLQSLNVEQTQDYRYKITLRVQWTPTGGTPLDFNQEWSVATDTGQPQIIRYLVR